MEITDQTELIPQDYSIVNHWAADNIFFRIETVFLHHMINDYIARCRESDRLKKLKQIKIDLYQLEAYELHIGEILEQQIKNLAEIDGGGSITLEDDIVLKHLQLEKLMAGLRQEYRAFKRVLYTLLNEEMQKQA